MERVCFCSLLGLIWKESSIVLIFFDITYDFVINQSEDQNVVEPYGCG